MIFDNSKIKRLVPDFVATIPFSRGAEEIIVAGEGGIPPKPDPDPFRICIEKLQIKASEAVYVGDDWRIDICGARDAGLHAVWLKHHTVKRNWPQVEEAVPEISNLNALLEIDDLSSSF